MAGYLEGYGVEDERRARIMRRIVVGGAAVVVIALVLYFSLRTYPAKREVREFLEDLRKHDYQAAYRLWGCAQPCRDYPFDSFMEDWGPKSAFGDPSAARIEKARYCRTGVTIVTLATGQNKPVWLVYQRSDKTLGSAPWEGMCEPHIPAPVAGP